MKKNGEGLIFKLDFEKVYDQVNLHFLLFVLRKIGFGDMWIRWIFSCILVAPVSALVNGSPGPKFCMGRGVHQGFPLSLLLFKLVGEAFLTFVNQFEDKGWLEGKYPWVG